MLKFIFFSQVFDNQGISDLLEKYFSFFLLCTCQIKKSPYLCTTKNKKIIFFPWSWPGEISQKFSPQGCLITHTVPCQTSHGKYGRPSLCTEIPSRSRCRSALAGPPCRRLWYLLGFRWGPGYPRYPEVVPPYSCQLGPHMVPDESRISKISWGLAQTGLM